MGGICVDLNGGLQRYLSSGYDVYATFTRMTNGKNSMPVNNADGCTGSIQRTFRGQPCCMCGPCVCACVCEKKISEGAYTWLGAWVCVCVLGASKENFQGSLHQVGCV